MADNVAITAGSGTTIAADDIGAGVLVQRVKTTWGPDGTANDADVATGKPLPVQLRSATGTAADLSVLAAVTATTNALDVNIKSGSSVPVAATLAAETTKVIGTVNVAASQTIAVTNAGTFAAQITPVTSGGLLRSRTLIPNNTTAIVVKASAGQVYKIRATNNSATIAYIKLYDATSATAGSGTPVDTIMIPAATSGGAGIVDTSDIGWAHATGITFVVTTGIADNDTGAPAASAYIVTVSYK